MNLNKIIYLLGIIEYAQFYRTLVKIRLSIQIKNTI